MAVRCTASLVPSKSSTSRSGFCIRRARASSRPSPSTRTVAVSEACVMATLEITAAVDPAGSCVCAAAGHAPAAATLARIRQPFRRAGQLVFIAVLLHSSKFSCSLRVPAVSQMRLSLPRGRSRCPWQSCPLCRRIVDRLRAESRFGIADWSLPRSSRSVPSRLRPAAGFPLATRLSPEADSSPLQNWLSAGPPAIQTGPAAQSAFRSARPSPPERLLRAACLSLPQVWPAASPFSLELLPPVYSACPAPASPAPAHPAPPPPERSRLRGLSLNA